MSKRLYKNNLITTTLIVVVLLASSIFSVYKFMNEDFNIYDNSVRMLVAKQLNQIEKKIYNKGKYPYIVFDLTGKINYNNTKMEFDSGENVNVQEMLQTDKSFSVDNKGDKKENFVLQKQGKVNGFVVFIIPENKIEKESIYAKIINIFLPMLIGMLLAIFVMLFRTIYFNKRVLQPITEISSSAKAIISGNYDLEVIRIYEKAIGENEVGDLTYSFELMRDELKEKQIREEALKKSQQELISCISHDLKTPISTIKAYSEGLRDGIARTEKGREGYVNIIISKTDLLIGMINELLEYSNTQLKQLTINRKEVYFLSYFLSVMKEMEVFVKQNDIEFYYDIKTPDMLVTIDKKRITEVLYNIVENSMKYMGEKSGRIIVEAERQEMQVLIKIKDNGIGISANDIPYVFDRFYRAEKSRSSSVPGSGLGLSICKYIINEHGGEIYCKSFHKEGCEIGFTLE